MGAPFYAKGRYVCEIVNQALGKSSTKGTPQFVLRFKVLGTPDPDTPENFIKDANQYERSLYRYLTEASAEYTVADLRSLGFEGDSFKLLDPSTPGFHNFAGLVVDMICDHEQNDKKEWQEKWGLLRGPGEFKVAPLEAAQVRQLDNLFGKHLKESKGASAPRPPQPAAIYADGVDDDSIPF